MTLIPSRITTSEALNFEFELPDSDTYRNQRTIFISQVSVNFGTVPTSEGSVEICVSDEQGEDILWAGTAKDQKRVAYYPFQEIPIAPGAKLIVNYENPDEVEATARVMWHF